MQHAVNGGQHKAYRMSQNEPLIIVRLMTVSKNYGSRLQLVCPRTLQTAEHSLEAFMGWHYAFDHV